MKREDKHIKPYMQILFGISLYAIHKMMDRPIVIIGKWKDTNWYDPSDELFFQFISWASLLAAISLTIIGIAHLIKRLIAPK